MIPKHKVLLEPLSEEDGGGWFATFPDLPGCMSDGETPEEAISNAAEAEEAWLEASAKWGTLKPEKPERLVRLPLSLHEDLKKRAKNEGVSINRLMVTLLTTSLATANAK